MRLAPRPCDERLRGRGLRVNPGRGRHLPASEHGEQERDAPEERALHARACREARAAEAKSAAAPIARSPTRSCNAAEVPVCGIWPTCVPFGRLALTSALRSLPSTWVGVTSTATRLVYALTRWCSSATFTTCARISGALPSVRSASISVAIFALAQRAPTPLAEESAEGVSATLQGWLPRIPDTTIVRAAVRLTAVETTMGSPR